MFQSGATENSSLLLFIIRFSVNTFTHVFTETWKRLGDFVFVREIYQL